MISHGRSEPIAARRSEHANDPRTGKSLDALARVLGYANALASGSEHRRAIFDAMAECESSGLYAEHARGDRLESLGEWIEERFAARDPLVTSVIAPMAAAHAARRERERYGQAHRTRTRRRSNLGCAVTFGAMQAAAQSSEPRELTTSQIPSLTREDFERIAHGRVDPTTAIQFVMSWARTGTPFLVLASDKGAGKSFAAAAWLACVGNGFHVNSPDLAKARAQSQTFGKLAIPLERLLAAPRLVVDEVALEASAEAEAAALFELVERRAQAKTILLTNERAEDLYKRVGARTSSRLRPLLDGGIDEWAGPDLRAQRRPMPDTGPDELAPLDGLSDLLTPGEWRVLDRAARPDSEVTADEQRVREKLRARGYRV